MEAAAIRFVLTDSCDYRAFVGMDEDVYTMKVSRRFPHWEYDVMDCLGYCAAYGIRLTLEVSAAEREQAARLYQGHAYNEPCLRRHEPRVLVHATTPLGYRGIQKSGALLSWNAAKSSGLLAEGEPIGTLLGDPLDFRNDCMLGGFSVSNEIVVCSREHGRLVMDPNARYTPGARLYFDAARIARDGLLIRDGQHLKVRERLPLQPYLLLAVEPAPETEYTPASFTEYANRRFHDAFPDLAD